MADLDKLLNMLAPQKLCRYDFEVDEAYKKFPLDEPRIATFPEFQELLGRYYGHLTRAVYHCGGITFDGEDTEPRAMDLVEHAFERGRVEAFDRASTGCDGGLLEVLRKVGEAFKKVVFGACVREALRQTVDMKDWSDREALAAAYLEKFRHVLPRDVAFTSPMILATRIEETIRAHVQAQPLLAKLPAQK